MHARSAPRDPTKRSPPTGWARTRLGYEVLVKLKMDELLEQAWVRMPVAAGGNP
jgi:hypothetical protein